MPSTPEAKPESIPLPERYRAASNELNQRLSARQTSYMAHAASAAAVLGFLFNKAGTDNGNPGFILIPSIIGLAFGFWIRSHDLTIGLLAAFCRNCEEPADRDGGLRHYTGPSFYSSEQGWQKIAMRHREWTEIAFVFINLVLCEAPVLYCIVTQIFFYKTSLIFLAFSHLALGVSLWTVISIRAHRKRMLSLTIIESRHSGKDGKLVRSDRLSEDLAVTPEPGLVISFLVVVSAITLLLLNLFLVQHLNKTSLGTQFCQVSVGTAAIMFLVTALRLRIRRADFWYDSSTTCEPTVSNTWNPFGIRRWMIVGAIFYTLVLLGFQRANHPVALIQGETSAYWGEQLWLTLFAALVFLGYTTPQWLLAENRVHALLPRGKSLSRVWSWLRLTSLESHSIENPWAPDRP